MGQDFKLSESESNGLTKKDDIKNKIVNVISKAEKEVDNESPKLFKGEEIKKHTDLSHRARADYADYDLFEDEDDQMDNEERVIRKANEAIRKNQ